MARTYQTARKRTGGRFLRRAPAEPALVLAPAPIEPAPVPAPAPVEPAPALALAPASAQLVEEVEEEPEMDYYFAEDEDGRIMAVDAEGNMSTPPPSPTPAVLAPPPAAPVPVAPAPAAARGDPGELGDDNDEDEEDDNNQDDGAVARREPCCECTSVSETIYFPMLMQDLLD